MFSIDKVMCGIFAISGERPVSEEAMASALAAMDHRGPDGSDYIFSKQRNTALGHCRLFVRGSQTDSQPIWNENHSIAISVNGEFYDDEIIRLKLESKGHRFRTTSDSEIALHLYEEYGLNCFQYLRGEFAFVIWDENQNRIIAARDRFGIKPICYSRTDKGLVLSSEAKAVFQSGMVGPEWDHESLKHILGHQYLPPEKTIFRNIEMIPPAHFLIGERGKDPVLESYWNPPFHEEEVSPDAVLDGIIESVKLRLQANHSPAFSLSGGIDSSAVVALAAKQSNATVAAFCVSFVDGDSYNEIDQVQKDAEPLGAELNIVPVDRVSMVEELSDAAWYSEGLCINSQLVGKYLLSRAIRKAGHNVVLSGEGADEAFLGYAHLQIDAGDPGMLKKHKSQAGVMLPDGLGGIDFPPPEWLGRWPAFFEAKTKFIDHFHPILDDDFASRFDQKKSVDQLMSQLEAINKNVPFEKKAAWLWTRTALSTYILKTLADGTEMAHSVEGRLPFLDHHLFETAFRAPTRQNFLKGNAKMLLRDSLKNQIPEQIRLRPKHPFLAPPLLLDPCPRAVREYIFDTVRTDNFATIPCFDRVKTTRWLDDIVSASDREKTAADPAIMLILSAAMIHRRFHL